VGENEIEPNRESGEQVLAGFGEKKRKSEQEMTWKYKCGHESNCIVMDSNILSFIAYERWAETVGVNGSMEKCWQCWNKERREAWKAKENEEKSKV
jgi:hypothetical protein